MQSSGLTRHWLGVKARSMQDPANSIPSSLMLVANREAGARDRLRPKALSRRLRADAALRKAAIRADSGQARQSRAAAGTSLASIRSRAGPSVITSIDRAAAPGRAAATAAMLDPVRDSPTWRQSTASSGPARRAVVLALACARTVVRAESFRARSKCLPAPQNHRESRRPGREFLEMRQATQQFPAAILFPMPAACRGSGLPEIDSATAIQ